MLTHETRTVAGRSSAPKNQETRSPSDEIDALFSEFRKTRDRALRNELVERHRWIGMVAARRFVDKGEPLDDLMQVAMLGVLKAVERFDPEYGSAFVSFALPTSIGELRRYFRDSTWSVHVRRRVKDVHLLLPRVVEDLTHSIGRQPRVDEIARTMRVSEDQVIEAMEAGAAYRSVSFQHRVGEEIAIGEDDRILATEDRAINNSAVWLSITEIMKTVSERDRMILYLRYFEDLSQAAIAECVGISQVHVSRILRTTLETLRRQLAD